jgi:DNA-binding NarL/FixJ family response regulator
VITILLADDHAVMRSGLRLLLERHEDLRVVGEAGNGREAVDLAESLKPDIAVMDIAMPLLNGIEATRKISASGGPTQVVILSMHSDESYVLRALNVGARAYILKESAEEDLIRAVRSVDAGKSFFSPAISRLLLDDYVRRLANKGVEDSYDLLTPREKELLQLLAELRSNKEIATLLNLSVHTVETHRGKILQKLNLHGVPELILYAVRRGLIS